MNTDDLLTKRLESISMQIEAMKENIIWFQEQYEYWAEMDGKGSAKAQHAKGAITGYEGALHILGVNNATQQGEG
jgi:hypothetical protein